jgi:hypothetical protein
MKDYDKSKPASAGPARQRGVTIMLALVIGAPLFMASQLVLLAVYPDLAFPLVPIIGFLSVPTFLLVITWYTRCRKCGAFWPVKWSGARPDQAPGAGIVPPSKVHRCRRCNEPFNR